MNNKQIPSITILTTDINIMKLYKGMESDINNLNLINISSSINKSININDEKIRKEIIKSADILFIVTKAIDSEHFHNMIKIQEQSKYYNTTTILIVIMPEQGHAEYELSIDNLSQLKKHTDNLLSVPSYYDQLKRTPNINPLTENYLAQLAVQSIYELISEEKTLIKIDLIDIKKIFSINGVSAIGTGISRGKYRAFNAAKQALKILDKFNNKHKLKGILVNITAGLDLSIGEFEAVANTIKEHIDNQLFSIGIVIKPNMLGHIQVTIIMTGTTKYLKNDRPTVC